MNRLRGMRLYEAGPMDRCTDVQAENWRKDMTSWLEQRGAIVFNPVEKPIDIGIEDKAVREEIKRLKNEEKYDEIRFKYGKKIRGVDLRMVDISDFLIVYVNIDIHMVGTYEEVTTAVREKKPVLVVVEQGKKNTPNWLLFMLDHREIFSSFDELKEYLDYIDKGGTPHSENRWYFFDQEKIKEPLENRDQNTSEWLLNYVAANL